MLERCLILVLPTLLLFACESEDSYKSEGKEEVIEGRDDGITLNRVPLYRIIRPLHWKKNEFSEGQSYQDTKLPIAEFLIQEELTVRITVHNFPPRQNEGKIPPLAQIERWKRQFEEPPPFQSITPQSFSGYMGFLYEGRGIIEGENAAVLGWALQIGAEHERILSKHKFPEEMRADITIKVKGPIEMVERHRPEIVTFARSFELLEEIPRE